MLLFAAVVVVGQNYPTLAAVELSAGLSAVSEQSTGLNGILGGQNAKATEAIYGTPCKTPPSLLADMADAFMLIIGGNTSDQHCIVSQSDLPAVEKAMILNNGFGQKGLNDVLVQAQNYLFKQQPTSAIIFAQEQVEKFNDAGAVYAQTSITPAYFPGTGFEMLRPIQNIWGWAVTASYGALVFVIIVVAIGLALRDRLPGKQTITLSNSIQGIVIAMILIPLSYPIAGLFVDLTTLGTNTVHGFLFGSGGLAASVLDEYKSDPNLDDSSRGLNADDVNINLFNVRNRIGVENIINLEKNDTLRTLTCNASGGEIQQGNGDGLQCPVGTTGFGVALGALEWLAGDNFFSNLILKILFFIINLAMLLTSLKLAWFLFKKYLTLLFAPIIMPFSFLTLALPGGISKNAFSTVKDLAATSAVFVAAYGLVMVSIMFSSASFFSEALPEITTGGYNYIPPLFGGIQNILIGAGANGINAGGGISLIVGIIGLLVYFSIPKILEDLHKKIAPPTSFATDFLKNSVGEFKGAFRPAAGITGRTASLAYQAGMSPWRSIANYKDPITGKTRAESAFARVQNTVDGLNASAENSNWVSAGLKRAAAGAISKVGTGASKTITGGKGPDVVNRDASDISKSELEMIIKPGTSVGLIIEGSTITLPEQFIIDELDKIRLVDKYIYTKSTVTAGHYIILANLTIELNLKLEFKSVKDKDKPIASGSITFEEKEERIIGIFGQGNATTKLGAIEILAASGKGAEYSLKADGSTEINVSIKLDQKYFNSAAGLSTASLAQNGAEQITVTVKNKNGSKSEAKKFNIALSIQNSKFSI